MRKQILGILTPCLFILAAGCQDTSQLESKVAKLSKSVEYRLDAIDEKMAKLDIDLMTAERQELKEQWGSFQRSFTPELRQELQQNLDAAVQKSKSIEEVRSMAATLLMELKQLESESKKFRDLTEQHSVQSKEFDKIGELEESLRSIKSKLSQVESDVRSAKQDADSAESRARRAEHTASSAESRARSAESAARRRP